MHYYITPEDYEKAKKNGINENLLYTRVYYNNWSIDRAINTPVQRHNPKIYEWLQVARKNGIKDTTYYARVRRGWSPEKAATRPTVDIRDRKWLDKQRKKSIKKTRVYPDWVHDNLKKYNISHNVFWQRVNKHGWSLKDASTYPTMKRGQRRYGSNENHAWRHDEQARYARTQSYKK